MTVIRFFETLWAYDFMRYALIAGTLAAIVSASVGYVVVLRNQNFAGHALSHIGFTGAAGAGLLGLAPVTGQLWVTVLAAGCMGALGERAHKTDTAIGMTLAFSLGLGVLFLYFYRNFAGHAMSILFGDLLAASPSLIRTLIVYSVVSLLGLALMWRPLIFATLEPDLAQAKGISLTGISIAFLVLVAIAITEASQVAGILLVFTLLIAPPASAVCCTKRLDTGLALSIGLGILIVWSGILCAYLSNWPVAFWISSVSFLVYLICKGVG